MRKTKKQLKVGDLHQTSMHDIWGLARITKIEEVKTDSQSGTLLYDRYDDVGYDTQATLLSDGTIPDLRICERQSRSGMPDEFVNVMGKDIDWDKYGEDVATQKGIANGFVRNFAKAQREGRGLYIYSKTRGSGKTMIACAITNEIIRRNGMSAKFITAADYVELAKAKDDISLEKREAIMNASLLVLDDIGAQAETKEWVSAVLYRLINGRNARKCPTIYTSNVLADELKTDSRIIKRINDKAIPLLMPEVNIRRKLSDAKNREFVKEIMKE